VLAVLIMPAEKQVAQKKQSCKVDVEAVLKEGKRIIN